MSLQAPSIIGLQDRISCRIDHQSQTEDIQYLQDHDRQRIKDPVTIIIIGLPQKRVTNKRKYHKIPYLLGTIFSQDLPIEEKFRILRDEFDIEDEEKVRKEVKRMTNWENSIYESAILNKTADLYCHAVDGLGYSDEDAFAYAQESDPAMQEAVREEYARRHMASVRT